MSYLERNIIVMKMYFDNRISLFIFAKQTIIFCANLRFTIK